MLWSKHEQKAGLKAIPKSKPSKRILKDLSPALATKIKQMAKNLMHDTSFMKMIAKRTPAISTGLPLRIYSRVLCTDRGQYLPTAPPSVCRVYVYTRVGSYALGHPILWLWCNKIHPSRSDCWSRLGHCRPSLG